MKIFQLCMIFCLSLFGKAFSVEEPTQPSPIQVLLEKETSGALLEVRGSYLIVDPRDNSKVSSGMFGKRFMIQPTTIGLKWGEEFPGIYQLKIAPKSEETAILVNGIQYDGAITVIKIGDSLNIINEVSVESYIKSVLTFLFPYPYEPEVMNAIAIAARTSAYYQLSKNSDTFWHVNAKEVDYVGSAVVVAHSAVSQAVDATKHMILVSPSEGKNCPFMAVWTEHSAGKTAPFQTIFRKDFLAPAQGVEAPHAALDRENSKWTFTVPATKFAQFAHVKQIKGVDLFTDNFSGKTYALRVKEGKKFQDINFFDLQNYLGKDHILSNDMKVVLKNNQLIFTGYGKGSGVGLCLYTASSMARQGDLAVKILSKFYPDSYLINLSALPKKGKK